MSIVINLFGAPSTGKSTTMARLFADLKCEGINCEMVSEFAKDLVYEKRDETMKDELYIFAKQSHRMFRVKDKVDVIITDRPLLLTCVYDQLYGRNSRRLQDLVREEFFQYDNVNILLVPRGIEYQKDGRVQKEDEAGLIQAMIRDELMETLNDFRTDMATINTTDYDMIKKYVKEEIEKRKGGIE